MIFKNIRSHDTRWFLNGKTKCNTEKLRTNACCLIKDYKRYSILGEVTQLYPTDEHYWKFITGSTGCNGYDSVTVESWSTGETPTIKRWWYLQNDITWCTVFAHLTVPFLVVRTTREPLSHENHLLRNKARVIFPFCLGDTYGGGLPFVDGAIHSGRTRLLMGRDVCCLWM